MSLSRTLALFVAAGALIAPSAHAQLLPPPPPPAEPEPEYTPPARPAARPAQPQAQPQTQPQTRPQTRAANPAQANRQQQAQRPTGGDIPDFPYAPLACPIPSIPACIDYEGEPAFYDRPMHIIALTRNPATTPSNVPDVIGFLADRRIKQLEPAILEHLDTILEIEDGLLETIGISDLRGLQSTSQRLKPLVAQPPLTQALQDVGALTRVQAQWNLRVMQQYQQALGEWWQESEPERASDLLLQHVMKDSVGEAMEAYEAMLSEVALRPEAITESVELPSDVSQQFIAAKTTVETFGRERSRRAAVDAIRLAMRALTLDQRRSVLQAVKDTRENPNAALIRPIDVIYEGKQVSNVEPARIVTPEAATRGFREGRRPAGQPITGPSRAMNPQPTTTEDDD
ncbi:MAG: hypothetical protein AAF297_09405 [Planctomycetota bacterium]